MSENESHIELSIERLSPDDPTKLRVSYQTDSNSLYESAVVCGYYLANRIVDTAEHEGRNCEIFDMSGLLVDFLLAFETGLKQRLSTTQKAESP